jgi:hypothetical protein
MWRAFHAVLLGFAAELKTAASACMMRGSATKTGVPEELPTHNSPVVVLVASSPCSSDDGVLLVLRLILMVAIF